MKINNFSAFKPVSNNNYKNHEYKKTDTVAFKQSLEVAGNFLPELIAKLMAAQQNPKTKLEFQKLFFENLNFLNDLGNVNPEKLEELLTYYFILLKQSPYGEELLTGNLSTSVNFALGDVIISNKIGTSIFPNAGVKSQKSVWLT